MKVIAIIPGSYGQPEKLIVEMSPKEFEKIHGHATHKTDVGTTVKVSKIFERLQSLKENQYKLGQVRNQLRAVADLLEPLEGVVGCDAPTCNEGNAEPS